MEVENAIRQQVKSQNDLISPYIPMLDRIGRPLIYLVIPLITVIAILGTFYYTAMQELLQDVMEHTLLGKLLADVNLLLFVAHSFAGIAISSYATQNTGSKVVNTFMISITSLCLQCEVPSGATTFDRAARIFALSIPFVVLPVTRVREQVGTLIAVIISFIWIHILSLNITVIDLFIRATTLIAPLKVFFQNIDSITLFLNCALHRVMLSIRVCLDAPCLSSWWIAFIEQVCTVADKVPGFLFDERTNTLIPISGLSFLLSFVAIYLFWSSPIINCDGMMFAEICQTYPLIYTMGTDIVAYFAIMSACRIVTIFILALISFTITTLLRTIYRCGSSIRYTIRCLTRLFQTSPLGFILTTLLTYFVCTASAASDMIDVNKIAQQFSTNKFIGGVMSVKVWSAFIKFEERFISAIRAISCQLPVNEARFTLIDILSSRKRVPSSAAAWDIIIHTALMLILDGDALDVARRIGGCSGRAVWKTLKSAYSRSNFNTLASFQRDCSNFRLPDIHPGPHIDLLRDKLSHLATHKCGFSDRQAVNILAFAINDNPLFSTFASQLNSEELFPDDSTSSDSSRDVSDEEIDQENENFDTPVRTNKNNSDEAYDTLSPAEKRDLFEQNITTSILKKVKAMTSSMKGSRILSRDKLKSHASFSASTSTSNLTCPVFDALCSRIIREFELSIAPAIARTAKTNAAVAAAAVASAASAAVINAGTQRVKNMFCWNCNGTGHGMNACKQDVNDANIAKNKEKYWERRKKSEEARRKKKPDKKEVDSDKKDDEIKKADGAVHAASAVDNDLGGLFNDENVLFFSNGSPVQAVEMGLIDTIRLNIYAAFIATITFLRRHRLTLFVIFALTIGIASCPIKSTSTNTNATSFTSTSIESPTASEIYWLGDSGATHDMCNQQSAYVGPLDLSPHRQLKFKIAGKGLTFSQGIGTIEFDWYDAHSGIMRTITREDVPFTPDAPNIL
jgi:hypothetical protein